MKGSNFFTWTTVTAYSPANAVWACVNQKTFEGNPNVNSTYNLNPSTYRETGVSGYAAALRTVGWDNNLGNNAKPTVLYHVAAGKLFLGSYSFDHNNNVYYYNYWMGTSS